MAATILVRREAPLLRFYRPELDVLRLFAFLLVYVSHSIVVGASPFLTRIQKSCGAGVQIFFCLSAYLITELLIREKGTAGTVDLNRFYVRRVLRIFPLYFGMLLSGFAVTNLTQVHPMSFPALLAYMFLVGNWHAALRGYLSEGMGVLWSIGVEEQFYIVWPALIKYAKRSTIGVACFLMWIASQVLTFVLCLHSHSTPFVWCNTLTNMQYFAIGGATSLLLAGKMPPISASLRVLLVASGVAIFLLFPVESSNYLPFLTADLAVFCLLVGVAGASLPKCLSGLVYLGKISYGLYVFHQVVLTFAIPMVHGRMDLAFLARLSVSVIISHLSYRYFERPFLGLKEQFAVIRSRPA